MNTSILEGGYMDTTANSFLNDKKANSIRKAQTEFLV